MVKKVKELSIIGIDHTEEEDLKRAFDFQDTKVPYEFKNPEILRIEPGHFKVSGDGVFYTLQGEGDSMGKPAVFLRLHFCNLRCYWCDAWYTWNSNTKEFWMESNNWSVKKAAQTIKKAWPVKNRQLQKRLVITGGEPLLQKNTIDQLIDMLPDWYVEVETNGTIMPTDKMLKRCQFNCSPKLENSRNLKSLRIKPDVLNPLNKVNTVFKFVVMTEKDIDEIERDFVKPFRLDINKIIIMPQGVTAEEVSRNARRVVEKVKEKGYKLLGRLQCDIWGARRRV